MTRTLPALLLGFLTGCGTIACGQDDPGVPIDRPIHVSPTSPAETNALALADLPEDQRLAILLSDYLGVSFGREVAAGDTGLLEEYRVEVVARCERCGPVVLDEIVLLWRCTTRPAARALGAGDVMEVRTEIRPEEYRLVGRTASQGCGATASSTMETAFALPAAIPAICPVCQGRGTLDGSPPADGDWGRADRSAYLDFLVALHPDQVAPLLARGHVHGQARRFRAAIANYEAALSLDPDHPRAGEARDQIAYWTEQLTR